MPHNNYYDIFLRYKVNKRYNKCYLFGIKKLYVLSSYRIYNIKFYYSPILFNPNMINKAFIKAIKRFCMFIQLVY